MSTSTKEKNPVPHTCDECVKTFATYRGYANHMGRKHGVPGKSAGLMRLRKREAEKKLGLKETINSNARVEIIDGKVHINSPYAPRPHQLQVHQDTHRYKVIVAHRRFGKTTLAINHLIKQALEDIREHDAQPVRRFWYIAPTYKQAKTIAFEMIKQFLPEEFIVKKHEHDLLFKLRNGNEISLKGTENPDSLRGVGLRGVVFDEYQSIPKNVWDEIIEPTLHDDKNNPGWAFFLGTPLGRNHFYELYKKNHKDWKSFHFSAYDTDIFKKDYLEEKQRSQPEEIFRQEYLAEFLEGEGTVFRNIAACTAPKNTCYEHPRYDKSYQLGVDLARLQDWTVLTVTDNTNKVVYFERFQNVDWEYQKLKIIAVAERYLHARTVIDATGVGDVIANDLRKAHLNIVPYRITTSEKKVELIENLKLRFALQQVTIPEERELIRELEAYKYSLTPSGRVKYEAPQGFHDDTVISLALSIWNKVPHKTLAQNQSHYGAYDDEY